MTTNTQPAPAPFSCVHSREFPDILLNLGCTLVLSTYQAGKVVLLSAKDSDTLVQLPRSFKKPMGLGISNDGQRLAVATQDEVVTLANAPELASTYPNNPNTYDALYVPRASYFTGELDIHDMHWGTAGLWAVNTRFSCLSLIDDQFSFNPQWQPEFISKLAPNDHCHLNGLAMENDQPRYVTALGTTDNAEGWRERKLDGGILMDINNQELLVQRLSMPHSPRICDDKLFVLNSASGTLLHVDRASGETEIVNHLPGFARGMAKYGDYLFIGVSKLRKKHATFGDLPIASQSIFCGVVVIHLPSGNLAGSVQYLNACEEIYDVQVLPNTRRPGILGVENETYRLALATPDDCFWGQAKPLEEQILN